MVEAVIEMAPRKPSITSKEAITSYCTKETSWLDAAFKHDVRTRGGDMTTFYLTFGGDFESKPPDFFEGERIEVMQLLYGTLERYDIRFAQEVDVPLDAEELWRKRPTNGVLKKSEPLLFSGPVIGIWGQSHSGKDTVCNFIKELRGNTSQVAFADPIKHICQDIYDFSDEQLWGDKKDEPDHRYPRVHQGGDGDGAVTYLTPRYAVQQLGIEWGCRLYERTWMDFAIRKVNGLFGGVKIKHPDDQTLHFGSSHIIERTHQVVISDVRRKQEVFSVIEAGGVVVRLERLGAGLSGEEAKHSTETDFFNEEAREAVRVTIVNDGTLTNLKFKVDEMLKGFGL